MHFLFLQNASTLLYYLLLKKKYKGHEKGIQSSCKTLFPTVFIFPTVSIPKEREKDTIELLQVMMWGLKIQLAIQREVSIIISSSYVWEKASLIGATYNFPSLIPEACIHSLIFIPFIFLNNSL